MRDSTAADRRGQALEPDLQRELDGPGWMFPWQLGPARVRLLNDHLPAVHRTREAMIEPAVRDALAAAGPQATALDLGCSEGWFSHRLLEWGARRVVGVDVRERNVHRACLVRDHFDISEERLAFQRADVNELDHRALGEFDVVLMLGLVYHLEDPVGAIRRARELTRGLCVIESQLTRQRRPIAYGWGVPGAVMHADASFAAAVEDAPDHPIASAPGAVSLIPNQAALDLAAHAAGFGDLELASASPGADPQYVSGDRVVMLARAQAASSRSLGRPAGKRHGRGDLGDQPDRGARPERSDRQPPVPPRLLAERVGVVSEEAMELATGVKRDLFADGEPPAWWHAGDWRATYEAVGEEIALAIRATLPQSFSWAGKRVLDFGCGAGRVLRHFLGETDSELHGCDIDEASVSWLSEHMPQVRALRNGALPPLPYPDGHFDLIWAASVFTHLTDASTAWLLELHRLLSPGGFLWATHLGPSVLRWEPEPTEWDTERVGRLVTNPGRGWDMGGPSVYLAPWWIEEHWGRAFEIRHFQPDGLALRPGAGQGVVLLTPRAVSLSPEELERD